MLNNVFFSLEELIAIFKYASILTGIFLPQIGANTFGI